MDLSDSYTRVRFAANPFPITEDMSKFVQEVKDVLQQLQERILTDKGSSPEIAAIKSELEDMGIPRLISRVVTGPYNEDIKISVAFHQRGGSIREMEGEAYAIPKESFIVMHGNLYGPGRINFDIYLHEHELEKLLLHEVIHIFHRPHSKKIKTLYKRPDPSNLIPYWDQNSEMTAYQGSVYRTLERYKQEGMDKERALIWLHGHYQYPHLLNGYEEWLRQDPKRWKDYMTRIYKMIEKLYKDEDQEQAVASRGG